MNTSANQVIALITVGIRGIGFATALSLAKLSEKLTGIRYPPPG